MPELGPLVYDIRSKNAGPFLLTIDIFCGSQNVLKKVSNNLSVAHIARVFDVEVDHIKKYEIHAISVLKFSLPRPEIQGSLFDRDMHGASWSNLLKEIIIN